MGQCNQKTASQDASRMGGRVADPTRCPTGTHASYSPYEQRRNSNLEGKIPT